MILDIVISVKFGAQKLTIKLFFHTQLCHRSIMPSVYQIYEKAYQFL
jgi:hypothetical protein